MKILYAADNNINSRIQLSRFLNNINPKHKIKIAAYKISSPSHINIDWTLDALLDVRNIKKTSTDNHNLEIYYNQIKSFKPDLIISDLEYYTSYLAIELNIPLWQCSQSYLSLALKNEEKFKLQNQKFYHNLIFDHQHTKYGKIINIIENSNRNFVYSHFGDSLNSPKLKNKYEWIRPYYQSAKEFESCKHYLVASLYNFHNKKLIKVLKQYKDGVIFTDNDFSEQYINCVIKDWNIEEEYYCNLKNSSIFVCEGYMDFLADAYYNGKLSLIFPDFSNTFTLLNSLVSQKLGIGCILSYNNSLSTFEDLKIKPNYSSIIKQLHQCIEEV